MFRRRFLVSTVSASSLGVLAGCSSDGEGQQNAAGSSNWQTIIDDAVRLHEDEYKSWSWNPENGVDLRLDTMVRKGPAMDFFLAKRSEFRSFERGSRFSYEGEVSQMNTTGGDSSGGVPAGDYVFVADHTDAGQAQPPSNFDDDVVDAEITLEGKR